MGKFAALVGLAFAMLIDESRSSGDVAAQLPEQNAASEPITGQAAASDRSGEQTPRDPFTPYEIGPTGTKGWDYQSLSPSEKAYVDRNRKHPEPALVHEAFAAAAKERAHRAASDSAAHQLGLVDDFGMTGVVP